MPMEAFVSARWGYCDGEHFFIRFEAKIYFQLYKTAGTYELYGAPMTSDTYFIAVHGFNQLTTRNTVFIPPG